MTSWNRQWCSLRALPTQVRSALHERLMAEPLRLTGPINTHPSYMSMDTRRINRAAVGASDGQASGSEACQSA